MSAPGRMPSERSFALSVGPASIAFGALLAWRGYQRVGIAAATIGAVLIVFGLVAPSLLRGPNRAWWRFATVLGWINSRILLTLFFVVVLTPVGWVMRLLRRDPLRAAGSTTNWASYNERRREPRHYEHLY